MPFKWLFKMCQETKWKNDAFGALNDYQTFFVLNFLVRNCRNFTLLWDYIFFYFLVLRWYCIKWMWCYWAVCFCLTSSFYITLKLPNITEFPKSPHQASFNVNILHGMVLWSASYMGSPENVVDFLKIRLW